jgi:hypothetical protein
MCFLKKKKRFRKPLDIQKEIRSEDLKDFIYRWNYENPMDRIYREKHNIKFNSESHRVLNFIDMALELYEDNMYQELIEESSTKQYIPNTGNFMQSVDETKDMSNEEFLKEFEDFDFSKYDDKNNE